jgi:hypothetical protein
MEVEPERATDGRAAGLSHVDIAYPLFGGYGVLDVTKLALLLCPARQEAVDPNLLVRRVAISERESVGGFLFSFVVVFERVSEEAAATSTTSAADATTTVITGGQGVDEEGYDSSHGEEIIIHTSPTSRRFGMIDALHFASDVEYRGRRHGENMVGISVQLQSTAHIIF